MVHNIYNCTPDYIILQLLSSTLHFLSIITLDRDHTIRA